MKKEALQKLRFETRIAITQPKILKALINSKLSLKIEEILNGDINNRRDVISGKFEIDIVDKECKFPFVQITTDQLSECPDVLSKVLAI